ncbi:MAG: SecE/Sec61-gamma subunit of protein translocation complex [Gaiellaceae bacterium]|nr:SecE/Sec61-gamma subunit of protein translocation complex [Gaiellaceae bacterium]MDX6511755.1 SecE/Sec61-gamma subunit of protein translocation complex [Gaiellaceae bacterium]
MARESRSERRARREARLASNGGTAPRAQRGQQGGAAALPARAPVKPASSGPRRLPGSGVKGFIGESWAELKKVEWPNQSQVIQATTVVLIACVIVGAFLYLNDVVWQHVVQNWLL